MNRRSMGKAALAVSALSVGVAAPIIVGGPAFAVGEREDGSTQADTGSYVVVQCPWVSPEYSHAGIYTGDQVCYVQNAATVDGSAASY